MLVGNNIVKIIGTENEVDNLGPGDKILLSSKAFNPLFKKWDNLMPQHKLTACGLKWHQLLRRTLQLQ